MTGVTHVVKTGSNKKKASGKDQENAGENGGVEERKRVKKTCHHDIDNQRDKPGETANKNAATGSFRHVQPLPAQRLQRHASHPISPARLGTRMYKPEPCRAKSPRFRIKSSATPC